VEAATVDRTQGRDVPCVLLSCTRTLPPAGEGAQQTSLLDDPRRLCVALTRAQAKLLLVGSVQALRAQPLTAALVALCEQRGWLVALPSDALR
jgi:DNA replication ATP-dependent helicase Dna2